MPLEKKKKKLRKKEVSDFCRILIYIMRKKKVKVLVTLWSDSL